MRDSAAAGPAQGGRLFSMQPSVFGGSFEGRCHVTRNSSDGPRTLVLRVLHVPLQERLERLLRHNLLLHQVDEVLALRAAGFRE